MESWITRSAVIHTAISLTSLRKPGRRSSGVYWTKIAKYRARGLATVLGESQEGRAGRISPIACGILILAGGLFYGNHNNPQNMAENMEPGVANHK